MDKRNFTRLAQLAKANDNVLTRAKLVGIGFTDNHIALLVKRKQWQQLQRGVYLVAPGPATWKQLARAGQYSGGESLALDAGGALRFWNVEGVEGDGIELAVVNAKKHPRPNGAVLRYPSRVVATRLREGVRVVGIEEALLSFSARTKDRRRLEVVVESVLLSRKSTERRLWRFVGLNSRPGVRGVALLRSVLERRPNGKPSRSVLELEVLDLIRSSDLPVPTRNADVIDANGEPREIDLCYLDELGAIEVDSKRWHSTETQLADDRRRQEALEAVGFRFVRVTWPDVMQRPEWVIEQIRSLLLPVVAA